MSVLAAPRDCAATKLADAETGEVDEYLEGWGRRLRARNRSEKTIRGYGETVQLFLQQRGLVIRSGSSIGVRVGRVVSIDRYACRALIVLAPGAFWVAFDLPDAETGVTWTRSWRGG